MHHWMDLPVGDLSPSPTKGEIMETIPDSPGIYVWRHVIPAFPTGNADELVSFIDDLCKDIGAVARPAWIASSIRLEGITFGVGDLTSNKRPMLRKMVGTGRGRQVLEGHIAGFERFLMPLYVGSASRLATRVYQHVHGQTDFSTYVDQYLGGRWEHLAVSCLTVGVHDNAATREYLELLELIAQRLFPAPAVQRPG